MHACTQVTATQSLGYGTYTWQVLTDPTKLHPNLVASPFIYSNDTQVGARWVCLAGAGLCAPLLICTCIVWCHAASLEGLSGLRCGAKCLLIPWLVSLLFQ